MCVFVKGIADSCCTCRDKKTSICVLIEACPIGTGFECELRSLSICMDPYDVISTFFAHFQYVLFLYFIVKVGERACGPPDGYQSP